MYVYIITCTSYLFLSYLIAFIYMLNANNFIFVEDHEAYTWTSWLLFFSPIELTQTTNDE